MSSTRLLFSLVMVLSLAGQSAWAQVPPEGDTASVPQPDLHEDPGEQPDGNAAEESDDAESRDLATAITKPLELLFGNLLGQLELEVKAFEGKGDEASLGFGYDYQRKWGTILDEFEFSAGLEASGNVAFDDETNPEDFLETKAVGDWEFAVVGTQEKRRLTPEEVDRLRRRAVNNDPGAARELREHFQDQVEVKLALNGGLESDQRFTSRNYTGGLRASVVYTPDAPDSLGRYLNVFDWPFALVRIATRLDDEFTVRGGSSFPTFVGHLDWVNTDAKDPRAAVGDTSNYPRLRGEVVFSTPVFQVAGFVYNFKASYQYFHEIDASRQVRSADLDSFDYLSLALTTEEGLFVSYRTGQLPFDIGDGDALEVGWKFYFDAD